MNVKRIGALLVILLMLFSCKNRKDRETIGWQRNSRIDSLFKASRTVSVDSGLSILGNIRQFSKAEHAAPEYIFRAYCKSALLYSIGKKDVKTATKMLDSARSFARTALGQDQQATYDLYASLIHGFDEAAVDRLDKVMPRLNELEREDRLLAILNYALLQAIRGNSKIAIRYNLLYLEENRKFPEIRDLTDELMVLNNLFFSERAMGDTAMGFIYLSEAERLIRDSIPGAKNSGIIYINLGEYYLAKGKTDSALMYFQKFKGVAKSDYAYSQEFIPYMYLAATAYVDKRNKEAEALIDTSYKLLQDGLKGNSKFVDHYFLKEFYQYLYKIKKDNGKKEQALGALEYFKKQDSIIHAREKNDQILRYEKEITAAKAEKELVEKNEKITSNNNISIIIIVSLLLVSAIAVILMLHWKGRKEEESNYIYKLRQESELKESHLRLQVESLERKRISKELHDELGGTLAVISLAAQILGKLNIPGSRQPIDVLQRNTKKLVTQTNDIIWALNDHNDTLESLLAYVYRFAGQFLEDAHLSYTLNFIQEVPVLNIDGFKRRCFFQSIKECLTNVVRHSNATEVTIIAAIREGVLKVSISDNGYGMPSPELLKYGNGIKNTQKNIEMVGGFVAWTHDAGTLVSIEIPLDNFGEKQNSLL